MSGRNDVGNEEKAKVLDMLKRLQENDESSYSDDEGDDIGRDLQSNLAELDIGVLSISWYALFETLRTPMSCFQIRYRLRSF